MFHFIYGMSSFPLTNSMIFQRGRAQPPTSTAMMSWINAATRRSERNHRWNQILTKKLVQTSRGSSHLVVESWLWVSSPQWFTWEFVGLISKNRGELSHNHEPWDEPPSSNPHVWFWNPNHIHIKILSLYSHHSTIIGLYPTWWLIPRLVSGLVHPRYTWI